MLTLRKHTESIPVFATVEAGPIPSACHPEGCYPYMTAASTSPESELQEFQMVTLENAHISATLCPDLGGRLVSLKKKHSDGSTTESLFDSGCVRPVRILPRGEFIGGGIELSFPISHTPSLLEKMCHRCIESDDRIAIQFGERELRFGMSMLGEFSLGEEDTFLTQRAFFYNSGQESHPWMSWSNAGIPSAPDTEFHFPSGRVLRHDSRLGHIDWETDGPRKQQDVTEMTGYFWETPDVNAFGAYTPSLKSGLYHIADRDQMPGIKLWTDGVGRDEIWVNQYTTDNRQCLEIQAGPLADQSIKTELAPEQSHSQTEFWIPTSEAIDIRQLQLPQPENLTPLTKDDLFSWARPETVAVFENLIAAHTANDTTAIPQAPPLHSNLWAPSGMDDLGKAMQWASNHLAGNESCRWLFQYGSWLAGRDQADAAIEVLEKTSDPRAHALSAWLNFSVKNNATKALENITSITDDAWRLQPQIAFLTLNIMTQLGDSTLTSRKALLDELSDLENTDEFAEAKASYLLDSGDVQAAYDLLTGHTFQLIHQRYERSTLLKRAVDHLGLPNEAAAPILVGEDSLATFGAYQEY